MKVNIEILKKILDEESYRLIKIDPAGNPTVDTDLIISIIKDEFSSKDESFEEDYRGTESDLCWREWKISSIEDDKEEVEQEDKDDDYEDFGEYPDNTPYCGDF